jgi:phosphoribosylanthranilate isomerase
MWPKAKRAVSDETAAAIAAAAKQHGAQAVGVFVDEDAATISRRCRAAGIPIAQLHGDASRAVVNQVPADLQVCCTKLEGCRVTPVGLCLMTEAVLLWWWQQQQLMTEEQ